MGGIDRDPSYLLDTHTVLWAMGRPEALSDRVRDALLAGRNHLSVISYWEVTIKSMKRTLDVGEPRAWWREALETLSAAALPLRPDHVSMLAGLPAVHKDPFDRMLVSQAITEGLTLVSADAVLRGYTGSGLLLIS